MKNRLKYLIILVLLVNNGGVFAQDGEGLFKAKCSTCHKVDGDMTGPKLQGVKQKWADADEADYLYEWVQNSDVLITTGKSAMAKAIENFSPTKMPAQVVTNADVDAIFDYVDNWTPPVVEETPAGDPTAVSEVIMLPNYHTNLNVFYALVIMAIVLLFAIAMISGAIKRYISSDYFKERLANMEQDDENGESKSGGLKNLILVIIGTTLIANSSNALEFLQPGDAVEGQPWLLVETWDLYALVVLNLLLVGVLLYLRRLFNGFVNMITDKEVLEAEPAVISKVNKLLTDVVAIEDEESILLHHEYDGIRELDNNLPPWWVWMFYGTIIFAVVYIFNYHILGTSDLQIAAYKKEMIQADLEKEAYLKAMAMNIDETNAVQMTDAADLSTGKELFATYCVTCHLEKGQGYIGPNLTDNNWIYGFDISSIYKTIRKGSPNGKMPEHESKMNPIEIQQIASFVMSMPDATGGAEPQGDIIQE